MLHSLRLIFSPLLSLTILMLGNGFFITFIAVRLHSEGENSWLVGAVTAAYYAGLVVGAFRIERHIARVGHIRAYATLASALAVVTMVTGFFFVPWLWIVLRFVSGICLAGLFIVIEGWFLACSDTKTRGSILSLYMIGLYGPQALGQLLLNVGDMNSLMPFCITVILCSLSVIPLSMTYIKAPQIEEPSALSFFKLYKLSPSGIIGCVCGGLVIAVIYGLLPLFLTQRGETIEEVSFVMGLIIFGGMLLQYPVGRLSDKISRKLVMVFLCASTVILSVLLIMASALEMIGAFRVLAFLFGGITFTLYPLSISHACTFVESRDIVAATQGLLLAFGVGASFGPLLAPTFMRLLGPMGLFVYFITVSGLLAFFFVWRQRRGVDKAQVAQQQDFVAMPNTTPMSTELNPTAEE
jgi:MFS family permease